MRKRILIVAIGAIMSVGGFAVAQNPQLGVSAENIVRDGGRVTLTGRSSLVVNGVFVKADKMVIEGREVTLEGNVRLTLPPPK